MAVTLSRRNLTIPTSGLILHLDAANTSSYPGTGTVWYDLSGQGNNFNIVATAYNSTGPKYMDFNGSYGVAKAASGTDLVLANKQGTSPITYICWTRIRNSSVGWRTLTRALSSGGNHQVIIQDGNWLIGMFDNTNGSQFNSSGYSQQSLPGYGTTSWNMLIWRFYNYANYYTLSYNDSPGTIRGSIASINSAMLGGICSLGGYNDGNQTNPAVGSQFWGDIGMFAVYNRAITDAEALQCYNAGAPRFMGAAQLYEETIIYPDSTVQSSAYGSPQDQGKLISTTTFTGSGTWTKPAGCKRVQVIVIGGGGGGCGHCESGGAGGYAEKIIDVSAVSTVSVTVGNGGAAVGYHAGAGDGGTSSFGSYCSATGGYGANRNANHTGGHGGVGSGGDVNFLGGTGVGHSDNGSQEVAGSGTASFFGGGKRSAHNNSNPSNVGYQGVGNGGAGANQGYNYSAGASGIVIVYAYS